MAEPLVSVIVLNWNGRVYLDDCLSSLEGQVFDNFEVLLVDNGSTDDSVEFVKQRYEHLVRLITNSENYGFARGNNIGIEASRSKYVALLNNDTLADPAWLREIVRGIESDDHVGMCACKLYWHDRPGVIDAVGHLIYRDGLNRGRGRLERDEGQFDQLEEVLFPPGCGCLYRREMLDDVGLFDEEFFAYGDDTDLGLRARLAGWKCLYIPTAVVYHKRSGAAGEYSPFKAYHVERNRVWIVLKYFPLRALLMSPFYTFVRFLLQGYGAVRHKGAAGRFVQELSAARLLWVLLSSYLSALKGAPSMLRKRRALRAIKRVSDKEIYSWFSRYGISAREIALKE